jgi:hypothetical protein
MKGTVIRLIITLVFLVIAIVILTSMYEYAKADEYYVLCRPQGEVNIRAKPKLKSQIVATAFFGDRIETDGKELNGFVHVTGLAAETDSGWIYKGLLVKDQPIASEGHAQVFKAEKVVCRKYASRDSKAVKRLDEGTNVEVYAISEEWCVTEFGYIMTEFLTLNAPVRGWNP